MVETKIRKQLEADSPREFSSRYLLDIEDRRFLDDQVVGIELHLVESLIRGTHGTWILLDSTSDPAEEGHVVCLSGTATTPTATLAKTAAMAAAGRAFGVVMAGGAPGGWIRVAINGLVTRTVTGLAENDAGIVRLNLTTAKLERGIIGGSDYQMGYVDAKGTLQLWMSGVGGMGAGGGGGPGVDTTAIHTTIASEISGLTAKATPADADVLVGEDSAAGFGKVKFTVAALKSAVAAATLAAVLGAGDTADPGQSVNFAATSLTTASSARVNFAHEGDLMAGRNKLNTGDEVFLAWGSVDDTLEVGPTGTNTATRVRGGASVAAYVNSVERLSLTATAATVKLPLYVDPGGDALAYLVDSTAALDEKVWRWTNQSGTSRFQTRTDGDGAGQYALLFNRSGTTVTEIKALATDVYVEGNLHVVPSSEVLTATNTTVTVAPQGTTAITATNTAVTITTPLWVSDTDAYIYLEDTNAAVDEKLYRLTNQGGTGRYQTRTDADGVGTYIWQVTRSGTTPTIFDLQATDINLHGRVTHYSATNPASTGDFNTPHNWTLSGRNSTNTLDLSVLRWGARATNEVTIGSNSIGDARVLAGGTIGLRPSGSSVDDFYFTTSGAVFTHPLDMAGNAVDNASSVTDASTTPATGGFIRLGNNVGGPVWYYSGSNLEGMRVNATGQLVIGQGALNTALLLSSGGNVGLRPGAAGSDEYTFGATGADWKANNLTALGSSVQFDAASTPVINQADLSGGGVGALMTVQAQASPDASGVGGTLTLSSGAGGAGGEAGSVYIKRGGATYISLGVLGVDLQAHDLFNFTLLQFRSTEATPILEQNSKSSGSGFPLTIRAQTTSAASVAGGNLNLSSGDGTGTGGAAGAVNLQTAGTTRVVVGAVGLDVQVPMTLNDNDITDVGGNLKFDVAAGDVTIAHADKSSGTADRVFLQGQSVTATGTGGDLELRSGDASTKGVVNARAGDSAFPAWRINADNTFSVHAGSSAAVVDFTTGGFAMNGNSIDMKAGVIKDTSGGTVKFDDPIDTQGNNVDLGGGAVVDPTHIEWNGFTVAGSPSGPGVGEGDTGFCSNGDAGLPCVALYWNAAWRVWLSHSAGDALTQIASS